MAKNIGKFVLRPFEVLKDYQEYASWWNNPPKIKDLSRTGLAIDIDGKLSACGFLYQTDSSFTVFAMWYCRGGLKPRQAHKALKMIIEGAKEITLMSGRDTCFIYTHKSGMIKLCESAKFVNHDGHLIWQASNNG